MHPNLAMVWREYHFINSHIFKCLLYFTLKWNIHLNEINLVVIACYAVLIPLPKIYLKRNISLLSYMMMSFWTLTAERQTRRIRSLAFHNIMRQHIGYFDLHQTGELNVRLSEWVLHLKTSVTRLFIKSNTIKIYIIVLSLNPM